MIVQGVAKKTSVGGGPGTRWPPWSRSSAAASACASRSAWRRRRSHESKELGYPHESWTTRLLARHAREHGPADGHACLAKLGHRGHWRLPCHPLRTCALRGGSNTTVTRRLPQDGHM